MYSLYYKKHKHNTVTFLCVTMLMLMLFFTPAYADGFGDVVISAGTALITQILNILLSVGSIFSKILIKVMGYSISDLEEMKILDSIYKFTSSPANGGASSSDIGGSLFNVPVYATAFVIWLVGVFVSVYKSMFSPVIEEKKQQPIKDVIMSAAISLMAIFISPTLMKYLFNSFTKLYSSTVSGADFSMDQVETVKNVSTALSADMNEGNGFWGSLAIFIITFLMIGSILFQLIEFIFECIQRYVMLIVIVFFSPLIAAAGVWNKNESTRHLYSRFVSNSFLYIINGLCLTIILSMITGLEGVAKSSGKASAVALTVWVFFCYGFIKISQQIDNIAKDMGVAAFPLEGDAIKNMLGINLAAMAADRVKGVVGVGTWAFNGRDKISADVENIRRMPHWFDMTVHRKKPGEISHIRGSEKTEKPGEAPANAIPFQKDKE